MASMVKIQLPPNVSEITISGQSYSADGNQQITIPDTDASIVCFGNSAFWAIVNYITGS